MSQDHDAQTGLVLMAFLMGAVTGAAAALLWAPTTGEQARRYLNERAREGRDRATDAAQRSREFVRQQREQLATAIDRDHDAHEQARDRTLDGFSDPPTDTLDDTDDDRLGGPLGGRLEQQG